MSTCLTLAHTLSYPSLTNSPSFQTTHPLPPLPPSALRPPPSAVPTATTTAATVSQTHSSPSWTDLLRSHAQSSSFHEAISTYTAMITAGAAPDNFAFPSVLKSIAAVGDLDLGKQVNAHVVKYGYAGAVAVANSLINMYGKCGDIHAARQVFDKIPERDDVSWNSMIAAACRFELWELSLQLLRSMMSDCVDPTSFTLVSIAHACSNIYDGLWFGKQVHAYALKNHGLKTFTNNALVTMYAKLGRVDDAMALFDVFDDKDLVSWNTIISALSQNDRFLNSLLYFRLMVCNDRK